MTEVRVLCIPLEINDGGGRRFDKGVERGIRCVKHMILLKDHKFV